MFSEGSTANARSEPAASSLTWTVHPVRRHHGRTVVFVLVFAVAVAGLWIETNSLFWAGFAGLVLLVSVRHYLLPTTYRLDDTGVTREFLGGSRKKPWSAFRSYYRDANGVLLSPFPVPSRLENFRGTYLIFGDNADAVMREIRRRMDEDESGGPNP